MLELGGADFSQGRSTFLDRLESFREPTAKVYVRLLIGGMDSIVYAQLDTGAAWSVLDSSLAHSLGLFETDDASTKLDTRFGRIRGCPVRIPIRFVAEHGISLDTNGTFFVSPDWPSGRTFLGYSGLLDSIRFALDPRRNHFYFGPGA